MYKSGGIGKIKEIAEIQWLVVFSGTHLTARRTAFVHYKSVDIFMGILWNTVLYWSIVEYLFLMKWY
jgi:hypothetical protein